MLKEIEDVNLGGWPQFPCQWKCRQFHSGSCSKVNRLLSKRGQSWWRWLVGCLSGFSILRKCLNVKTVLNSLRVFLLFGLPMSNQGRSLSSWYFSSWARRYARTNCALLEFFCDRWVVRHSWNSVLSAYTSKTCFDSGFGGNTIANPCLLYTSDAADE